MATKIATLPRHAALLRLIFGIIWAIDAAFKWEPAFRDTFLVQIKAAAVGQPGWLHAWFHLWINVFSPHPLFFAVLTAIIESCIAVALLIGLARRATYVLAAIFSVLVWAIAEGFGGPYVAGSTDIGTAVIYALVFFALYQLDRVAGPARWTVDTAISKRFPSWKHIANP